MFRPRIETGEEVSCALKERRAGDPPVLVADPTKAEEQLRFKARRSELSFVDLASEGATTPSLIAVARYYWSPPHKADLALWLLT
jgi:hypothetical protein